MMPASPRRKGKATRIAESILGLSKKKKRDGSSINTDNELAATLSSSKRRKNTFGVGE